MSLVELCLTEVGYMIENSHPENINDCKVIVQYINRLPPLIISLLEELVFAKKIIQINVHDTQLKKLRQYIWNKLFLQKCSIQVWLKRYDHSKLQYKNLEVFKLLLETLKNEEHNSRVELNSGSCPILHLACIDGNLDLVELMLDTLQNKDVNSRIDLNARAGNTKQTALHMVCEEKKGHVEIAKLLLCTLNNDDASCRIDMNARDIDNSLVWQRNKDNSLVLQRGQFDNWTAWHKAIYWGHLDIVKLMLETLQNEDVSSRIDLNAKAGKSKQTALHMVCEEQFVWTFLLLHLNQSLN